MEPSWKNVEWMQMMEQTWNLIKWIFVHGRYVFGRLSGICSCPVKKKQLTTANVVGFHCLYIHTNGRGNPQKQIGIASPTPPQPCHLSTTRIPKNPGRKKFNHTASRLDGGILVPSGVLWTHNSWHVANNVLHSHPGHKVGPGKPVRSIGP